MLICDLIGGIIGAILVTAWFGIVINYGIRG